MLLDVRPDHLQMVLDVLQKHVPQYEVWAFGSRAKWTAKDYSDLDLCVVSDKPLSFSLLGALAEDFSESDLPWKVDVVDWATVSESFRKIIERDKVVVQMAAVKAGTSAAVLSVKICPTIRVLPDGWQVKRLGSFCTKIGTGATPRGGSEVYLSSRVSHALIRSQHVFDRHFEKSGLAFITEAHARELQNAEVRSGDVLLNITGDGVTFGRSCIAPDTVLPACVNQHVSIIRTDRNECEPGYLLSVLTHPAAKGYIESFNAGGSRRAITKGNIEAFEIALPPLPEQKTIAHILGTFDDKIEMNRRMNGTLEAIARAMFKSWFVDFDPVRAKMSGEPPESICQRLCLTSDLLALFPDRLVDSELGEIPEGWEVHGLNSMATLVTKSVAPSARPDEVFEHYSIPAFDAGATPSYEFGATIKSNKYVVSPNAVLVSKLNPETQRIWLPAVKTANAVCSTEFMQFEPRFDCIRSFLYLLMNAETMQADILKRVTGSTGSRQRAQPSQIAVLPIVVPTENVVNAFDLLISPMLSHAMSNVDQSQTLAALRDALLPKLLSGELRVNDDVNINAKKGMVYG